MRPVWGVYPMALGQVLSCAAFGGLGLLLGWDGEGVQAIAISLALAFIYVPGIAGREAQRAFSAGRIRSAALLAGLRALLQWDPEIWKEARILSAWARLEQGPGGEAEARAFSRKPAALLPLRWVQVCGLVKMGRHGEAIRFFERNLGWQQCVETPSAAWLVRAYAEEGRIRDALLALSSLDRWAGEPELRRRLLERILALPALLGRLEMLEAVLRELAPPAAVAEGWRSRAASAPAWVLTGDEEALLARWCSSSPPSPSRPRVRWREGRSATLAVLGLCAATFAAGLWAGDGILLPRISNLVLFGGDVPPLVRQGEWWRLVSAAFLHAGLVHLALNGLALWVLGEIVEGIFGRRGCWLIFLGSAVAGTAASAFVARAPLAVGASGGVFGFMGAGIGLLLARRGLYPPSQRRALLGQMVLMTAANLALGLSIPQVDNTAHLGGLAGGFLLGLLLHPVSMPDCPAWQRRLQAALAACGAAAVLVSGVLAVRNALGAGYPRHPGPLVNVPIPGMGYALPRPAWWEEDPGPPPAWGDGLGLLLEFEDPAQGPLGEAGGAGIPRGAHRFLEHPFPGGVRYLLRHGGLRYGWTMRHEGGWTADEASALARKMLSGLVFADEGIPLAAPRPDG